MSSDAIVLQNVTKTFSTDFAKIIALDNVNLRIKQGEFVAVIGPSGCGKTTLLRLIGALLEPTSGSITINGLSADEARKKRQFGWVFQDSTLFPWRSVLQNVQLPDEVFGISQPKEKYKELLELVRLTGFENSLPRELSGGMRSRVAIARALSLSPSVLLMDEPFGSLDELTRDRMQVELSRIHVRSRNTVLLVTHSIQEAVFLSNRILIMNGEPGGITQEVENPLPDIRELSLRKDQAFMELVDTLRRKLEG